MSEHITQAPTVKRLERSSTDRLVAGVCGGLGRYVDLNPAVFRLGFVVLTLLGGAGILVYLAAVLVVPDDRQHDSIAAEVLAERRDHPWRLVAFGLVGVALVCLLSRGDLWPGAGAGWLLILLGGLIVLWASQGGRRARRVLVGLTVTASVLVAAAVAAVALAFAWFDVSLGDGVGNRVYQPAALSDLQTQYALGVGSLRVDLSDLGPLSGETHLRARVGVGELRIVVPRGAAVAVDAHAKAGDLLVFGRRESGTNAEVHAGSGPIRIEAKVGAGRIDVVRAR